MAQYGYGGGYSTTTYGAQGGAEGGGFVGGSQAGSQDTPSSKTYGKETVRPVTIKQIIDAIIPHPSADHKIDGVDITQLSLIGQILSVTHQTTNTTFKIDDGTGVIEIKQWKDADAPETPASEAKEGDYIHVWGRLKDFNGKRHIGSHVIRPITDFNEISYHLLEATAVHLYFSRGPPESVGQGGELFVKSEGGNDYGAATNGGGPVGGRVLSSKLSANAKKVFHLLNSAPQNNEGLHVQAIAQQTGIPSNDVFKSGDELLQEGLIYTTVDDETWAVLEYE